MTLPTSGPLSLSDIQTEFGGSNPISLNEYYAGGSYVPAGTSGTYGAVPSSGAISLQNFYGTASTIVNFTNASVSTSAYLYASAGYIIYGSGGNIGKVYVDQNGSATQYEQWVTPTSAASNYEVYASYTGDTPTGTTYSWVACSTSPTWYLSASSTTLSCTLTMHVRLVGTTTDLDTWTVTLYADAYSF